MSAKAGEAQPSKLPPDSALSSAAAQHSDDCTYLRMFGGDNLRHIVLCTIRINFDIAFRTPVDNYEAALSSPQGSDFVAQVTRLYLVVHGRPPDPGGLRAHVEHMHAGQSLRDLALAFLDSEEFNRQAADREPANVLCRNALGTDDAAPLLENYESLCDLVVALVRSSEVAARLPILPALYPDGVPLTEPRDYRV